MDASRYFTAMHNAMSAQHPRAQLLLTVKLQDTCGNDACLELKQLPGESTSILCYSTMGRRCLNFQLFRKGWQLCHNADGQLIGRFPSSADGLIDETDFRAYCREDRLDLARTQRITAELRQCEMCIRDSLCQRHRVLQCRDREFFHRISHHPHHQRHPAGAVRLCDPCLLYTSHPD